MVLVRPSPCKSGQASYPIQQWIPLRTHAGCPGACGIPRNAKPHDNTLGFLPFTTLYQKILNLPFIKLKKGFPVLGKVVKK